MYWRYWREQPNSSLVENQKLHVSTLLLTEFILGLYFILFFNFNYYEECQFVPVRMHSHRGYGSTLVVLCILYIKIHITIPISSTT